MDLGEERGFCEIQSTDDLIAIESVARVMIEETVSLSLWNEQNCQENQLGIDVDICDRNARDYHSLTVHILHICIFWPNHI